MSQFFSFPPSFATAAGNPSVGPNGSGIPADSTLVGGKSPGGLLKPIQTDANGNLNVNILSGLVPTAYDYIALTYVPAGNGAGQIATATYYIGGSGGTIVATLTMAYNAGNQLISVTKT